MSYLIIVIITLLLILFDLKILKTKIYSPLIIFQIGYLISTLFAIYGLNSWNTEKSLSSMTVLLVLLTLVSFNTGGAIFEKIKDRQPKKQKIKQAQHIVHINTVFYVLSIFLYLITAALIYIDLKSICNKYACGASNVSELIYSFRLNSASFSDDAESLSFLSLQLIKVCNILTVFYISFLMKNLQLKDPFRRNIKYVIAFILNSIIGLLQSGRGAVLTTIIAAIILYCFYGLKISDKKDSTKKIVKRVTSVSAIVLVLFYASAPLIGRKNEYAFSEYITFYYGCSIPSLNRAIENPLKTNFSSPLENSIKGLDSFLVKLRFRDKQNKKNTLPFVLLGDFSSNVYTSAYSQYMDFGLSGVIALSALSAVGYEIIYQQKERRNGMLFYSLYGSKILDSSRNDAFFKLTLSTGLVTTVILFIIVGKIILINTRSENK